MDAVIYTRKSTASDGRSTKEQERECRHWCDVEGHPVDRVFCDEGISASRFGTKSRDAWADLKAYLRPGHILVVWEASRANRDLEEFVALRNLCAQLRVPLAYSGRVLDLSSGDDRFVGGLDALIAERESEQIRTRVLRAMRAAVADGRPHSRPPWGYHAVRPAEWVLDPMEAPRVREAVRRTLEGESQYSVLQWLKETGYAPASASSLRRALCNPAIAGRRTHRSEDVGEAVWPAIITLAQHHQLVGRVKRMKNLPGPQPKYLLSGIAKCGECGEALMHRNYAKRKPLYICRKGHVARLVEMLDKAVEERLFRRLKNVNPDDYDSDNPRVAEALHEIDELEQKLQEWIEAAGKGEVTPAAFAKIEKSLRQRIKDLTPRTASKKRLRIEEWENYTMREKREAIRALLIVEVPPLKKRGRALPGDVIIKPLRP